MTGPNLSYTRTAKALHWMMAVMIFGLLCVGIYMHDLPLSPDKLKLYSYHKWMGVTVFMLLLIRLGWRLTHQPPALPASMPQALQLVAHAGHWLLYGLMFVIPLSGWLMSSAKGFQTVWFGVLPLPDLLEKNKELGELLAEVHEGLNMFLIAVILGHIAAALKHHFIDKDDILKRMMPAHRKSSEKSQ